MGAAFCMALIQVGTYGPARRSQSAKASLCQTVWESERRAHRKPREKRREWQSAPWEWQIVFCDCEGYHLANLERHIQPRRCVFVCFPVYFDVRAICKCFKVSRVCPREKCESLCLVWESVRIVIWSRLAGCSFAVYFILSSSSLGVITWKFFFVSLMSNCKLLPLLFHQYFITNNKKINPHFSSAIERLTYLLHCCNKRQNASSFAKYFILQMKHNTALRVSKYYDPLFNIETFAVS